MDPRLKYGDTEWERRYGTLLYETANGAIRNINEIRIKIVPMRVQAQLRIRALSSAKNVIRESFF